MNFTMISLKLKNMVIGQNYVCTDTDSLIYGIKTEDFYNDIKDDIR